MLFDKGRTNTVIGHTNFYFICIIGICVCWGFKIRSTIKNKFTICLIYRKFPLIRSANQREGNSLRSIFLMGYIDINDINQIFDMI